MTFGKDREADVFVTLSVHMQFMKKRQDIIDTEVKRTGPAP